MPMPNLGTFASMTSFRLAIQVLALLACLPWIYARDAGRDVMAAPGTDGKAAEHPVVEANSIVSMSWQPAPALHQQQPMHAEQSRRMMQSQQGGSSSETREPSNPSVQVKKFAKIALNISRPLGTTVNGAPFSPGPCGDNPSALGYQCSWVAPGGAVLHWTYSSSSTAPPINRCTAQQQAVPNLEIQEFNAPVVHFALQAASQDMLHLAFVDPEGRFYPSEGVHGRAINACNDVAKCNSTSTPQVDVLYHTSPGSYWSTGRISSRDPELMEGWAGWVSADTEGQSQVICMSRHVQTKLMKLGPLAKTELLLEYAVGGGRNYMNSGRLKGMVSVDLVTGKITEIKAPSNVLIAHAVLMLVAFGVLLPMGLLLARHKWLFVDEDLGLSPLWGLSHFSVLLLCAMVGLTGMIVALVRFGNTIIGMVMSTHQVLGLLSVGLSLVLVIMYGLRPFLVSGQKHAPSPLLGPQKVGGVVTIAAGWTSLFLGCVVIHQNWAVPYLTWLLPCITITALVACAAILLELRYQKLVRTGAFNPRTCTMSNAGPSIPLARIRTHREPTDFKKHEAESSDGGQRESPLISAHHGEAAAVLTLPTGSVAATMLARSIGIKDGDINSPGRSSSSAGSGRASSSGGAGELYRRARHSTPNGAAMAQVQTGFPSTSTGASPHRGTSDP